MYSSHDHTIEYIAVTEIRELTYNFTSEVLSMELLGLPILWFVAPLGACMALIFAMVLFYQVKSANPGNSKMIEIATYVREGARAYLKQQYKGVTLFFIGAFIVFLIMALGLKVLHWLVPFAFLTGGFFSGLAGYIGMNMATLASNRTAQACSESLNKGLKIAFRGGAVMGLTVVGLALIDISIWFFVLNQLHFELHQITVIMLSFGMGASTQALFARLGGGIFTKAADVGADLVGKVEAEIPEDDVRNPATIADNVGDNVGDVAGMGADLYESYAGSILATAALGMSAITALGPKFTGMALNFVIAPMVLAGIGALLSIIGVFMVSTKEEADTKDLMFALNKSVYGSSILIAIVAFFVTKQLSLVNEQIEHINTLDNLRDELQTYISFLEEDFNEDLFGEAINSLENQRQFIEKAEIECYLNGKYDRNDAVFSIHAGAGGTEAQDWAEMLLRMYSRWAERNNYSFNMIDMLPGEEAGIKSVTVEVGGNFAYGMLKAEVGIHRLVRISPFNAQGKRQTSFASVYVYPEFDDDIEVEIDAKDLKIDTYRSSGAGGQHVNTTDSAVRITHQPTGIVVSCQNERSQIQNREKAMNILKSRLYQYYEEQREAEKKKEESSKTEIGWGNQIRSYVFQPYQMVKDHRTNHEVGTVDRVMDGDLDGFIYAWLKEQAKFKNGSK
jgi:peptide chain release factor 2